MHTAFRYLVGVFALLFIHISYFALAFAASIPLAALLGWGFHIPFAIAYFWKALTAYLALIPVMIVLFTTFNFQNCCVGLQRFRDHLSHAGWEDHRDVLLGALVWPWGLHMLDLNLRPFGSTGADAILNALSYWFLDRWRGTRLDVLDMRTGEVDSVRLKSPELMQDAVVGAIIEQTDKE